MKHVQRGKAWPQLQSSWPFPHLGIDSDIYFRLQTTILKLLLHHKDFQMDTSLLSSDTTNKECLAMQLAVALQIHTPVDDIIGHVKSKQVQHKKRVSTKD